MQALVHFFALLGAVSNTVLTLSVFGVQVKFIFVGLIVFDILIGALVFNAKSYGRTSANMRARSQIKGKHSESGA